MPAHEPGPGRHLGLPSTSALVVASMIGAGVFTTSGFSLAALGSREQVLLAWAVGGVIALLGALCYGALAARMAESGGEYLFLTRTVHPFAGFLAGWVSLLAGFTAPIALAAAALQAYLRPWWPSALPLDLAGTLAIALAALLHGLRVSGGVRAQNAVVALKLLLVAGLAVLGLARLPPAEASPPAAFSLPAFAASLVWISLSYSGWNAAVYVGGEVQQPARNLPRSMLLGTLLVTLLYLALNAVFVYAAPVEQLAGREDVAAVAARALGGAPLEAFTRVVIALALASSILAMVMTGPRVYARMAQDGMLPRVLGMRGGVPARAVAAQALLSIAVLWSSTLQSLLGYIGYTLGLSTVVTVIGLLRLRRREGAARVRVPGGTLVPWLFMAATLGAALFMMGRSWQEPVAGLGTLVAGSVVYVVVARRGGGRASPPREQR